MKYIFVLIPVFAFCLFGAWTDTKYLGLNNRQTKKYIFWAMIASALLIMFFYGTSQVLLDWQQGRI